MKIFLTTILIITLSTETAFANDRPIFATITASWCSSCQKLKPVIEELEYEYQGKINFITLDTSSKYSLEEAKQTAEDNGISGFFNANKVNLPIVGILCPGGKLEKSFTAETRKEVYEETLNNLLTNTAKICTL